VGGAGECILGVPLCSDILGTLWGGEIGGLFLLTGVTVSLGVSAGKEEVGLVLMTSGKRSTVSSCVSTSSKILRRWGHLQLLWDAQFQMLGL